MTFDGSVCMMTDILCVPFSDGVIWMGIRSHPVIRCTYALFVSRIGRNVH